jgi:hypothetical protein
VDVRLDEKGGLLGSRAGVRVRDRRDPDVAPLVGRADACELEQARVLDGPRAQERGQLVVPQKTIEREVQGLATELG